MDPKAFEIHPRVLERMLSADWISRYEIKADEKMQIEWTDKGRKSARLLKRIITEFQLSDGPDHAARFDILCANALEHGVSGAVDREIAHFWRGCLDELHLTHDEIDLACLIHGIDGFDPDDNKRNPERKKSEATESQSGNDPGGTPHEPFGS
jgi:hypothetical protein